MQLELPGSLAVLFIFIIGFAALTGPVLIAWYWRQRKAVSFREFFVGILIFALFQPVLRLSWLIPLARWVNAHPDWKLPYLFLAALTAALFEECGRWVAFRYVLRNRRNTNSAVMYGLGHGGLESMLFTGVGLVTLAIACELARHGILTSATMIDAIHAHARDFTFQSSLYALVERASALIGQVGLTLIVLQTFKRRQPRWIVTAIFLHFLIDFAVVMMDRYWKLDQIFTELVIAGLGIAIFAIGVKVSARLDRTDSIADGGPEGAA